MSVSILVVDDERRLTENLLRRRAPEELTSAAVAHPLYPFAVGLPLMLLHRLIVNKRG